MNKHTQDKRNANLNRTLVILALVFCSPFTPAAQAKTAAQTASDQTSQGKLVGKTRMTYLYRDVYDAYLYSPTGKWQAGKPFSLKLTYLRDLKGKAIAKRSVEEMKKQGMRNASKLTSWGKQMQRIFPDVKKGSSLIGVVDSKQRTTFYYQGKKIGVVKDPDFTQWFFDIWLSTKTSEPKLRKQLLGLVK